MATLVVAATVGVSGCAAKPTPAEQAEIRASLEVALQAKRPPNSVADPQRAQRVWKDVRGGYTANDEQLIWTAAFDSNARSISPNTSCRIGPNGPRRAS